MEAREIRPGVWAIVEEPVYLDDQLWFYLTVEAPSPERLVAAIDERAKEAQRNGLTSGDALWSTEGISLPLWLRGRFVKEAQPQ